MADPVESLIVDLLQWVGREPRPYADVMEAWRTSCPRLPVWEEANARGFLDQRHLQGGGSIVVVTEKGWRHLQELQAARRRGRMRSARATQARVD